MKQKKLNENFLVLATKSLTDERTFILKHDNNSQILIYMAT